jgi:hypothetical protein
MSGLNDEYLIRLGQQLVDAIKSAINTKNLTGYGPSVASGELVNSIRFEFSPNELKIFGKQYIGALQYGRKPTTGSATQPTLRERIREWIDVKGIQPDDDISKDSLAYLIARKIHEEGTLIYQKTGGESSGLLDDVINVDLVEEIRRNIILYYTQEIKSNILKNVPKEMKA